MIVHENWQPRPDCIDGTFLYKPENLIMRNSLVLHWYGYLKWRIAFEPSPKQTGQLLQVEYVWNIERFPFIYRGCKYFFMPDLKVFYQDLIYPEYQVLEYVIGSCGAMYRMLLHKYPFMQIRILESIEIKTVMENMYLSPYFDDIFVFPPHEFFKRSNK